MDVGPPRHLHVSLGHPNSSVCFPCFLAVSVAFRSPGTCPLGELCQHCQAVEGAAAKPSGLAPKNAAGEALQLMGPCRSNTICNVVAVFRGMPHVVSVGGSGAGALDGEA